jgi:hypothetical protein
MNRPAKTPSPLAGEGWGGGYEPLLGQFFAANHLSERIDLILWRDRAEGWQWLLSPLVITG